MSERVLRRAQPWLGTLVEIGVPVVEHDAAQLMDAVSDAFDQVAQVHGQLSRFEPQSDVSRFNQADGLVSMAVGAHAQAVLRLAAQLHQSTGGLFDIARGSGQWALSGDGVWSKLDPQVEVDLGGIAKGYAVDRAMACLAARGIKAAWINAGGDLKVMGMSLPVELRDEAQGGVRPWASIENAALATSFFGPGARSALHGDCQSAHVSVVAAQCAVADALTKVIAQVGLEQASGILSQWDAQAWVHA